MALSVSSSNVDGTSLNFFFTSDKDVVPLGKLSISDLFIDLALGSIDSTLETFLVQILVNWFTVVSSLLWDGKYNDLSRWKEEWPFSTQVLNQNSGKALNWTKDSSMDDDGAFEAWL